MVDRFTQAMMKLATVAQDPSKLIDCSEAVPAPKPPASKPATFPAGTGPQDLDLGACASPFPSLATDRKSFIFRDNSNSLTIRLAGAPTHIPACPDGSVDEDECEDQVGSMRRK